MSGIEDRFWSKVDRSGDCWVWTGARTTNGYGSFGVGPHKTERAHRTSWMLVNGPIPDGLWVLHRCDNPPCVNPAHLFLGTRTDNMRDAAAKGRLALQRHPERAQRGDALPWSKLSEARVLEIRAAHASGASLSELGRRYGLNRKSIRNVVLRIAWRHVA